MSSPRPNDAAGWAASFVRGDVSLSAVPERLKPAIVNAVLIMQCIRQKYTAGDLNADFVAYMLDCGTGSCHVIPSSPSAGCVQECPPLRRQPSRVQAEAHAAAKKVIDTLDDALPVCAGCAMEDEGFTLKLYRRRTIDALAVKKGWPIDAIPKKLFVRMAAVPRLREAMVITPSRPFDYSLDYGMMEVMQVAFCKLHYEPDACANCGKTENVHLRKCSRCRLVWYCGTECQGAHWRSRHKAECRDMVATVSTPDMTMSIVDREAFKLL